MSDDVGRYGLRWQHLTPREKWSPAMWANHFQGNLHILDIWLEQEEIERNRRPWAGPKLALAPRYAHGQP